MVVAFAAVLLEQLQTQSHLAPPRSVWKVRVCPEVDAVRVVEWGG